MKISQELQRPITAATLVAMTKSGPVMFRHGQLRSMIQIFNSNRKDETLLMKKGYRTDLPDTYPDGKEIPKCRKCNYSIEVVKVVNEKPMLTCRWCSFIKTRVDENGSCRNGSCGMTPSVFCYDPNHMEKMCDLMDAMQFIIGSDQEVMNTVMNTLSTKPTVVDNSKTRNVDKSASCGQTQDVVSEKTSQPQHLVENQNKQL